MFFRGAFPFFLLLFVGCGGRTPGGAWPTGDGGPEPPDARVIPPDSGGDLEFCEGQAKVEFDNSLTTGMPITTTPVAMDCCDGATIRFHLLPVHGFDIVVFIRAWVRWVPGDFTLGDSTESGVEVRIYPAGEPEPQDQTVSGWLRVRSSGDPYEDPFLITLCAEVDEPGGALDGLRLFVEDQVVMPWGWTNRLEVRLLDDPDISASEAAEEPLGSLALDVSPVITLGNITYYQASAYTVHLEPWYLSYLEGSLPPVGFHGLPFVVLVDGERIYLGAFITALSSATFRMPVIVIEDLGEDSATIEPGWPGGSGGPDPRNDSRILDVLREAGKLIP